MENHEFEFHIFPPEIDQKTHQNAGGFEVIEPLSLIRWIIILGCH